MVWAVPLDSSNPRAGGEGAVSTGGEGSRATGAVLGTTLALVTPDLLSVSSYQEIEENLALISWD